jgi:hypothetical protein
LKVLELIVAGHMPVRSSALRVPLDNQDLLEHDTSCRMTGAVQTIFGFPDTINNAFQRA